jgi:hypothetical protein
MASHELLAQDCTTRPHLRVTRADSACGFVSINTIPPALSDSRAHPGLSGTGPFGVVRDAKLQRDNDPDLHTDQTMYSCGSLVCGWRRIIWLVFDSLKLVGNAACICHVSDWSRVTQPMRMPHRRRASARAGAWITAAPGRASHGRLPTVTSTLCASWRRNTRRCAPEYARLRDFDRSG